MRTPLDGAGGRSTAGWPEPDRRLLLSMPGLGPTALERLQHAGIGSLAALRTVGVDETVDRICRSLGNRAWRNRRHALDLLLRRAGDCASR